MLSACRGCDGRGDLGRLQSDDISLITLLTIEMGARLLELVVRLGKEGVLAVEADGECLEVSVDRVGGRRPTGPGVWREGRRGRGRR